MRFSKNGLNKLFDAVFVISLRGSLLRRQSIVDQFQNQSLGTFEWVDAIDGTTLDLESLRNCGQVEYCHDQCRNLFPGEVGCYLSHLQVFTQIKDRKLERALICEDDIIFTDNARELFYAVMQELPAGWDIAHFHSHIGHGNRTLRQRNRRRVSPHLRLGWNESHGTLCYAITARCAQYFNEQALPIKNPIDALTNRPTADWCRFLQGYISDPFPCFPGDFGSDIGDKKLRQGPITKEPVSG